MAPDFKRPLFEMNPNGGHPSRRLLAATMLILLVVVIFGVFQILPLGPERGLSNRRARKMMADAEHMESESLPMSAGELYERVCDDTKVHNDLRRAAALRLAGIYRDELHDPRASEAALEKAYFFSKEGAERDALRKELETLRGRPVEKTELSEYEPRPTTPPQTKAPETSETAVARIGDETVSLEAILYAWSQFYGNAPPHSQEFRNFVNWYLDMTLLADEARREQLDRKGRGLYDLQLKRLLSLNESLTQSMLEKLPLPDERAARKFYDRHQDLFAKPPGVVIGHIVVADEKEVKTVEKALKANDPFEKVAREHSLDAKILDKGYIIGEIAGDKPHIPHVGQAPGLAAILLAQKDGATTGPIHTQRGFDWIKVIKHVPAEPQPFEAVKANVYLMAQKQQLDLARVRLLNQLRRSRPIKVFDDRLPAAASAEASTTASRSADRATTLTGELGRTETPGRTDGEGP